MKLLSPSHFSFYRIIPTDIRFFFFLSDCEMLIVAFVFCFCFDLLLFKPSWTVLDRSNNDFFDNNENIGLICCLGDF